MQAMNPQSVGYPRERITEAREAVARTSAEAEVHQLVEQKKKLCEQIDDIDDALKRIRDLVDSAS